MKRDTQVTVTAYVEGNMEYGQLYYSKKIVVFGRNQVLFTLSNTAVVVAHATCLRIIAHTSHTRIRNANTRIEVVDANLLCDCCCPVDATK